MSIVSFQFFVLVAAAVLVYWLFPAKIRFYVLLLVSWIFIWYANDRNFIPCLIMGLMIIVAYFGTLLIESVKDQKGVKKVVLFVVLLAEAGTLIWLKDVGFFNSIVEKIGSDFIIPSLIAPLGISYFALSLIGYILDVYWGTQIPQYNFFKLALFGSYFPLLTSGPIVRYRESGEELIKTHILSYRFLCFGTQRILWGIFKKIVISERIGILVSTIYGDVDAYPGLYVWVAMAGFVLQLYTDFSGCIDILLGVSELFGIVLPENFDLPFSSRNLSEFWRRWHITLGQWLKDYVLYPILKSALWQKIGRKAKKVFGKKTGKKLPVWIGLFISWFMIGFWHGGSWNYIIGVGLWFWFLIVLGELFNPVSKKVISLLSVNTECFSWHLFQSVRTFVLFMFGLTLFPAPGFMEGLKVYKSAMREFNPWIFFNDSFLKMGLSTYDISVLKLSLLILTIAGIVRIVTKKTVREWISGQNTYFRWTVWLLLIVVILIYGRYGPGFEASEFIYRGF